MDIRSKLIKMEIYNFGCFGSEGATIELDNILCLVGENNSGKSAVLKAYENVVENKSISPDDKCKSSGEDDFPEVVIYVHIPEKTPNIAEKWKFRWGDYLLVKSRWRWDSSGKITRNTWDPELEDYAEDGKAAGLDNVFSSRLPKPFRIGTLEDPENEHKKLLTLVLQPIADKLKIAIEDQGSELNTTIKKVTTLANQPISEEKDFLKGLKDNLNRSHNEIFPHLGIDLNVDIGKINFDPLKQLKENSYIKFLEWTNELQWTQQGTGSQRALFWAMMQVRSELDTLQDIISKIKKDIKEKNKERVKLIKEKAKATKEKTKIEKDTQIEVLQKEILKLERMNAEELKNTKQTEISLPSYMLLIDEPEVALHPKAVRTASKYLYNLAKDPAWQIMLTTHSPVFINLFEDHTTIIRLSREKTNPTPQTYRSNSPSFSSDDLKNIKLLNKFDTYLAEIFFGGYPIILEGDTEYAAFEYILINYAQDFSERPLLTRAHGKATICLIVRILRHFKIPFAVLHDLDFPFRENGARNGAWGTNNNIFKEIQEARKNEIKVIHRVSIPYFETQHDTPNIDDDGNVISIKDKDKPWNMLKAITSRPQMAESVRTLLKELCEPSSEENPFGSNFEESAKKAIEAWAKENEITDKRIFKS